MSKIVNVAVVGYGGMGGWHTRRLQEIPQVHLAGVYDILPERNQAAEEAGIHAYQSYEELLADPAVDVVTVAIPNDAHRDVCIQAMEAGKLTISEKPVTMSTAILEEMIAASVRTGSKFTVHQNRRWDEDFLVAKKIVEDDQLGRVFASLVKMAVATAGMCLAARPLYDLLYGATEMMPLCFILAALAGALVYALLNVLLRTREMGVLVVGLLERFFPS